MISNKYARAGGRERVIDLPFKPPYDWPSMLHFFRSHSMPGVERVTGELFARAFRLGDVIGALQVSEVAGEPKLRLRVVPGDAAIVAEVAQRARRMFDLDCDPVLIAKHFHASPLLAVSVARFPGLRVARGWDPFETAICSILGQLVSARQRAKLIGQLVENYGEKIVDPLLGEPARLFPDARILSRAKLAAVRTTVGRREAIRDFSRRVLRGAISFSAEQDPAAFRAALLATKGLGPWTVEYVALRAMGMAAFPGTDLILKRALELHPDLNLAQLAPWRAYAATYLWKEYAETLSGSRRRSTADPAANQAEAGESQS